MLHCDNVIILRFVVKLRLLVAKSDVGTKFGAREKYGPSITCLGSIKFP